MRIAVLIPCLNEEKTIKKVISDFSDIGTVYVYDNNSVDKTFILAKEAGAVVRFEENRGKGNVVRAMLRDIDADCYLLVDGDNTYPAESAMDLCKPILEKKADMVVGDRFSTYFEENKRLFHGFGNKLVRRLVDFFWGGSLDVMSGYRALSSSLAKSFPAKMNGFEVETELTIYALRSNYKVQSVPISYRDRPIGSESKLSTCRDGTKILWTIFKSYLQKN